MEDETYSRCRILYNNRWWNEEFVEGALRRLGSPRTRFGRVLSIKVKLSGRGREVKCACAQRQACQQNGEGKGSAPRFLPAGSSRECKSKTPERKREREENGIPNRGWLVLAKVYRLSGGVGSGHSCLLRASSPLPFDPLRPITSLTSSYVRPRLLPPERRFELRSRRRKFPSNPSSRRLFGNLEFDCTFARRDQRYEKIVAFRRNFIYPPFSFSLWFFLEIKFERRFEEGEFHCGFVRGFGRDFFRNFIDLLF